MRIQHNIMAMSAYRNYNTNTSAVAKNLEKLSSGYKINRAGDDAAGLAISEKMRAQITGLNAAQKNVKDGISLVKTAEGAMQEIQDMLNRMDYLATQSANGTYDNEVDRKALQDEVDQLLSEIDRIADSANFNGIKLLDGTLGMNTEAFKVGSAVSATDLVPGSAITPTYGASNASTTHIAEAGTAKKPEFTVDFSKLVLEKGTAAGSTTLKITLGTASFTVSGVTASTTASQIAAKFMAKITGTTASTALKLGAGANTAWFKASVVDGTKLHFTLKGVGATASAAAKATTASAVTSTVVNNFDNFIGQKVQITTGSASKVKVKENGICDITEVTRAEAAPTSKKVGISITVDANLVADGNRITIGVGNNAQTFTFKTKGSDSVAGAGANVIDVSKFCTASGVAGAEAFTEAIAQLTNKTVADVKIGAGAGANELHVDMVNASKADDFTTYDDVKGLITAQGPDTAAKGVGVKIAVDSTKIAAGDTLTIDGKKYVFTAKGTEADTSTTKYLKVADGMTGADGLKAALESAGYTVEADGTTAGRFIIRAAATAVDAKGKPVKGVEILGKGLTLQIGDTSDSFNQLGVSIQNMHAASLGVGNLKINTAESAAAAIQTVKDAINTVSSVRGTLGATQNRLEHTANNLSVMAENIQDAESSIRDTDIAEEMMSYTKNNILVQSAQAMLAQANQVPQGVLQLLG